MKTRFIPAVAAAAAFAGCHDITQQKAPALTLDSTHHGFVVKGVTPLDEVGGRLWRLEYAQNGADLVWLERNDENKTFAIAFRTLPEDDTGVAHILEHSVLCGSKKYPVKEPFVDLLKSSLATFLNAFTSKDQTVYPVSSRNERDFLNLTDVYLDAVFHPASAENPVMFRQEGWHYEFTPEGTLVRNGVVYNEMKGVYANPDAVIFKEISRLLFPDTFYAFDSGGAPAHIGALTFEAYQAFYRKHYHPSNAHIFLDGAMDIEQVLAKIDSYLREFPRRPCDTAIPDQKPVHRASARPYAIGPDEDPSGKTLYAEGWLFARYDDLEKDIACDILCDALAGSNEAPLKKALLDKHLCEDLELGSFAFKQAAALLVAKHVPDGQCAALRATVRKTLEDLAAKGLDHTRLAALLDRHEFRTRELFSGGGTCGLEFMNRVLDQVLYGGDPAACFRTKDIYARLRGKIASGWFERFLLETFVTNPGKAELTLVPSKTLAAETLAAEKAELAKILKGWDEATKARIRTETAEVDRFRNKVDTPEACATLPRLTTADIPRRGRERALSATTVNGVNTLQPAAGAKGVFYLSLRFLVDDFTDAELKRLPFLATCLSELATEKYDPLALKNALDADLGRFEAHVTTTATQPKDALRAHTTFTVNVAALDAKAAAACALVPEILLRTRYDDTAAIGDLLRQERLGREREANTIAARNLARRRAAASFSTAATIQEHLAGISQLRYVQALGESFAAQPENLGRELAALARRVFVKDRLTVILSDNVSATAFAALYAAFPAGTVGPAAAHPLLPARDEGFTIAAETAYAAKGFHLGRRATGADNVAARVLSLTYLWDEIRVKGGAYGGGLNISLPGHVGFLSWRDPNPKRSLETYDRAAAALKAFARGEDALDRYVVGTVGAADPCLTPRGETELAGDLFFAGRTYEDLQTLRAEILDTTREKLVSCAEDLTRAEKKATLCVIGGSAGVTACSNRLDAVEAIVPPKDPPANRRR